ncbi:MAG: CoB--CoM heterodisulfide reductase subunit C [archaeon]|nr:CoB--CoM heterodisulfide reductase subunit C [archaeon]
MENIEREKIDKISSKFSDEIVKDDLERIRSCFQCGTCTGGCPSGRRTAMRTRAVIRKALLGLDEVLSDPDIWLCSTCYTCYSRCPRDIPVTDIIIKIRNLATQKGYMMASHKGLSHMLIKTGHGVPIAEGPGGEPWRNFRESFNLSPLPPTTHSHPEAVDDIKTLIKSLKFDKLVDFKEEE